MNTIRSNKGFTLIELMIVVAILAILMAIAIPAYQDYTIRSQVTEGMNLTGGARTAVAEYWTDRGTWPATNDTAGLDAAGNITGNYVTQVEVGAGKITATFGNNANAAIDGDELVLSPTSSGGSVEWSCGSGAGTNIENRYLPARCRS